MKHISFNKPKNEKKMIKEIDEDLFDIKNQVTIINKIYLEDTFTHQSIILREIQNKLNSYKHQDIEKNKYSDKLISLDQTIEKLVCSKMKCFFCKKKIYLIYKFAREELQWTLDRIDNNQGHTNDNTLICCLKCNLQKKTRNNDAFKFTKQLKINKILE